MPRAFAQEMGNVFYLGAQEVRARVSMAAQVESLGVLHDYPATKAENYVEVRVGELYQGAPRMMLLEFQASALSAGGELSLGHIEIRYKYPGATSDDLSLSFPVLASAVPQGTSAGPVDLHPVVGRELLVLHAARAQAEAVHK